MFRRKFLVAPFLILILLLIIAGAASGASILRSADQIAQVVSPPDNNGSFPISSMLAVSRDGQLEAIPSTVPPNQVFIATRITGYFIAADPNLNGGAVFNLGDYYRMGPQLSNGFCSFSDTITPGNPITGLGATVYLYLTAAGSSQTAIAGKLNLRVMGYLADIN
jgi:hypothetical protein